MNQWALIFVVICAVLVGLDAQNLGVKHGVLGGGMVDIGPFEWFLVVALLWIVGFPAYLLTRSRYVALGKAPSLAVTTAAPGWKPDLTGRHESRYWDGQKWTDNVADDGVQSIDRLAPQA